MTCDRHRELLLSYNIDGFHNMQSRVAPDQSGVAPDQSRVAPDQKQNF